MRYGHDAALGSECWEAVQNDSRLVSVGFESRTWSLAVQGFSLVLQIGKFLQSFRRPARNLEFGSGASSFSFHVADWDCWRNRMLGFGAVGWK